MIPAAHRLRVGRYLDLARRLATGLAVLLAAAAAVYALGLVAEIAGAHHQTSEHLVELDVDQAAVTTGMTTCR